MPQFRRVFKEISKDLVSWFPGHMGKGFKDVQRKLRQVDCIIEVRDARIPFSGRNTDFKVGLGTASKSHILVLNKVDTIDKRWLPKISDKLRKDYSYIIYTNCKNQKCEGVQQLLPLTQELIKRNARFNINKNLEYHIMVIGIPNVGKSSLINTLRNRLLHKGKASAVGATPGITRSVLHKIKINENPLVYMIDTPGILTPTVEDVRIGLKLALCATIQDHLVGELIIADYLLFWMNNEKMYTYVDVFKLKEPTDDILVVLTEIAKNEKKYKKLRDVNNSYVFKPDLDTCAKIMLQAFRTGQLGQILLDQDILIENVNK